MTRAAVPLAFVLKFAVDVTVTGAVVPPPVVPFWFISFTEAQPTSALGAGGVVQLPEPPVPPAPAPPLA
jgi:hypothetical protein